MTDSLIDTPSLVRGALALTVLAPLLSVFIIGIQVLLWRKHASERFVTLVVHGGLMASIGAGAVVLTGYLGLIGAPVRGDIEFGDWLRIRDFRIPAVLLVDRISITIALFASVLTALVARFSRTYLHKEPGFTRFFTLLGLFATGTQLVALAGALELFFAGWELIGISSAFFIGFFHERDEPVRSSVRAFATYRFSDAGLLIATVMTFDALGSARFSALGGAATLPAMQSTAIALLFLLSAMGKSAQLPFSGWLPRAMEGPTPSSALFYGAVSIHAGLFLLLRVWPMLEVSMIARTMAVIVGLATAVYAAAVVRVHTDAKGALAHATLAQVGLILAEIGMGWTTLALAHLVCHAFLRLGQYLKAPNMIHDSHRLGHANRAPSLIERWSPKVAARVYAASLHRLRLDDLIDTMLVPMLGVARLLDRADQRFRRALSADERTTPRGDA
jgi:NADH:ubiquinone oxidoreductase subunit 5 (subunit L)/multisubunit Na+/H+ antiporter MnhA subunit